jgi:hypothetical protein
VNEDLCLHCSPRNRLRSAFGPCTSCQVYAPSLPGPCTRLPRHETRLKSMPATRLTRHCPSLHGRPGNRFLQEFSASCRKEKYRLKSRVIDFCTMMDERDYVDRSFISKLQLTRTCSLAVAGAVETLIFVQLSLSARFQARKNNRRQTSDSSRRVRCDNFNDFSQT